MNLKNDVAGLLDVIGAGRIQEHDIDRVGSALDRHNGHIVLGLVFGLVCAEVTVKVLRVQRGRRHNNPKIRPLFHYPIHEKGEVLAASANSGKQEKGAYFFRSPTIISV